MIKRIIILTLLFIFSFSLIAYLFLTKRETVFCSGDHTFYGAGQTKTAPPNFEQLPLIIQNASNTYLQSWLGQKFFNRFHYYGGRIIDRKLLSEAMKADSTIPDYVLYFSFSNEYENYTASLLISSSGKIISDIDFPNISKYPEKENIISREVALEFLNKECEINAKVKEPRLSYDKQVGSFVWIFDNIYDSNAIGKYRMGRSITIDAHSGKLIGQTKVFYIINE
ncbi:MAG: hypothetical protein ACXVPM_15870 [Bacteroidia bacterium]